MAAATLCDYSDHTFVHLTTLSSRYISLSHQLSVADVVLHRPIKLKFHGSSFLLASSWHPRDILARMSLTCYEEIGRVGRRCYEDAGDMSATSRACRARGIWRTTRHTDKLAELYTAADCRPINQVSAWQPERGSRPTRAHPRI